MSIKASFTRELKENLNYNATWLPNVHLELGDVGVLEDNEFKYRTKLAFLDIPFTVTKKGGKATFRHTSAGRVKRELKLEGSAPAVGSALAQADAGITFAFNGESAIVFQADGCTVRMIADQEPLKRAILAAFGSGKWEKNYVVVTELVEADATTIIVAQGSGGRFELRAKAGLVPSFDAINASGNFSVVSEDRIGWQCVAERGMTPLFRALGVKTGWIRDEVVNRSAVLPTGAGGATSPAAPADGAPADAVVADVDYADYGDDGMDADATDGDRG